MKGNNVGNGGYTIDGYMNGEYGGADDFDIKSDKAEDSDHKEDKVGLQGRLMDQRMTDVGEVFDYNGS